MSAASQTIRGLVPPRLPAWVAGVLASVQLLGESRGGVMTDPNYSNPVTYQQHLDIGRSYKGTVVHFMKGNTHAGSGVLVNNRRCILTADHVVVDAGQVLNPVADNIRIVTDNFMLQTGLSIPASYFVRFPARITAPSVSNDFALVILAHDFPGGIPVEISSVAPVINDVISLIGGGQQATPTIASFVTGDLIGGRAPITRVDTRIRTVFTWTSAIPLVYNANNGDSGGGAFSSDRKLYGIMTTATAPSTSAVTYSINLSLPENKGWVDSVAATIPSIPYVPAVLPTLSCEGMGSANLRLKTNRPSIEEGGQWLLQTATDFQTWTNNSAIFSPSPTPGYYECVIPIDADKKFFRLKWESE